MLLLIESLNCSAYVSVIGLPVVIKPDKPSVNPARVETTPQLSEECTSKYGTTEDLNVWPLSATGAGTPKVEVEQTHAIGSTAVNGWHAASESIHMVVVRCAEAPIALNRPSRHRHDGWLRIDRETKTIWVEQRQVALSRKEYDALMCLHRRCSAVCTKEELIAEVWPDAFNAQGVSDSAVDQLIHRLRRKIESDPEHPERLISRKGFGYMLML